MQIKVDVAPILGKLTPREFVIKALKIFFLQLLFFYILYPDALSIMGSSLLVYGGIVGLLIYIRNRFPFKELSRLMFFYILIMLCAVIAILLNRVGNYDYIIGQTKTQMGFMFTAYLIIFILFNVHKTLKVEYLVGYLASAVLLQCIITLMMNKMPEVNSFLSQYTNQATGIEQKRDHFEKMRLVGYGSALFGGGMMAGLGLIMQGFLIVRLSLNKWQLVLAIAAYCFTFFIGLFTARTALVGCFISVALMVVLTLKDQSIKRNQFRGFLVLGAICFVVGAILCLIFFPDYTDWAFEMFTTYQKTGSFSTQSSDTLEGLLDIPFDSYQSLLWGRGRNALIFWGNDMGYSRMLYMFGMVGTFLYFVYMIVIIYSSLTKDIGANLLIFSVFIYCVLLNIKGLTDLNSVLYLFFFFFMFYKYYVYYPQLYLGKLIEHRKLTRY